MAEKGDAEREYDVGDCYHYGYTVPQDTVEAIRWYRKAAEHGYKEAQYELGAIYYFGRGVPKDTAQGIDWFIKDAEQGDVYAKDILWSICQNDNDIPKNLVEWSQQSVEKGGANAEYTLGLMYAHGRGVPKDGALAAKWYRKAAEQGFIEAQFLLALIYDNGEGVPQDYALALEWYRRGANADDALCQNNLGVMYEYGNGVPQDYVEAYKWYNLAAAQGQTNAIHNRDILASLMRPGQIAEAQKLSIEFKPLPESISTTPASPDNSTVSGTGFFITDDGYLISNYHVVKEATKVHLVTSAGLIDAKVVRVDAANDLALLKAQGKFYPLPVAESSAVNLGNTVTTIGFPNIDLQGFAPKLAKGEIASLAGTGDDPRYFQISVPVQPGNSGGALVDERGNVIGIVSAKLDASAALATSGALPENVNYAVKSRLLLSFLESVPAVSAKLKAPNTADEKFSDVVKSAQDAAVLVLVY